jgi:hypothetical protein
MQNMMESMTGMMSGMGIVAALIIVVLVLGAVALVKYIINR